MRLPSIFLVFVVAILWVNLSEDSFGQMENETFITIHKVSGNQIAYSKSAAGGRGGRRRGGPGATGNGGGGRIGKGRGRFGNSGNQGTIATIPLNTKITTAYRERRTFEFNVGAEIPGGLRNKLFQRLDNPLQARVVTKGNAIVEINVVTSQSDINQSNSDNKGETVIAIRPKRPPQKKKK